MTKRIVSLFGNAQKNLQDGILVAEEEGEQAYTLPLERDVIADVSNMNLTLDRLTVSFFLSLKSKVRILTSFSTRAVK